MNALIQSVSDQLNAQVSAMLSGFIPVLVEKLKLSEDDLKTMLDEVLEVKNPRALAVKKVVADENRCIYIAARSSKDDKRCVKKHSDGSEYCTAHRKVMENRVEKAKTPKSPKGKKVATPVKSKPKKATHFPVSYEVLSERFDALLEELNARIVKKNDGDDADFDKSDAFDLVIRVNAGVGEIDEVKSGEKPEGDWIREITFEKLKEYPGLKRLKCDWIGFVDAVLNPQPGHVWCDDEDDE
jgi:hypothetical protein